MNRAETIAILSEVSQGRARLKRATRHDGLREIVDALYGVHDLTELAADVNAFAGHTFNAASLISETVGETSIAAAAGNIGTQLRITDAMSGDTASALSSRLTNPNAYSE